MIEFHRDGTELVVHVGLGISAKESTLTLARDEGREYTAELIVRQLDRQLTQKLTQIRREAYEQGWKDAKAKKRAETWFSGSW